MKNTIVSTKSYNESLVALLLRLVLGGLMAYHGYLKLEMYDTMMKIFGDPIGIGQSLSVHLVIFAEFFCGILLVIGLFTRLAVIPIFITMLVAFTVAHAKDPFQVKMIPFIYLLLCFPVFIAGSGRYSADAILFRKRNPADQLSFP
ncbi:MAG TPA: DoxX family protein [Chitinophagaceae bacterium]